MKTLMMMTTLIMKTPQQITSFIGEKSLILFMLLVFQAELHLEKKNPKYILTWSKLNLVLVSSEKC